MNKYLALLVLSMAVCTVSAGIFGAGNSLNKRYPGTRPIGYGTYHKMLERHHANRRATTQKPASNWFFGSRQASPSGSGNRPLSFPVARPNDHKDSSEEDLPVSNRRRLQYSPRKPVHQRVLHFPNDRELVNQRPVFLKRGDDQSEELVDASVEYEDFS